MALSAAVGVLVGLRAIVGLGAQGMRSLVALPAMPRATFHVAWSDAAVWPTRVQAHGMDRMAEALVALVLAAAAVAVLNTIVLLVEAGASRRREIAVRAAVGGGPWRITGRLLADLRALLAGGWALGLLLGLTAGAAVRATWPGLLRPVDVLHPLGGVLALLLAVTVVAVAAYAVAGFRVAHAATLASELVTGGRATDPARAVAWRRALMALQMAVAGSVLCATLVLASRSVRDGGAGGRTPRGVSVVPVTAPHDVDGAAWGAVLSRLAAVPGLRAESLATPGALVGLGVRDEVQAQCGQCIIGYLYVPMLSVSAVEHAVGPGFFTATGRRVLEGRDFTPADSAGAAPVAIVNQMFAHWNFRQGPPLGHEIQVGTDPTRWYKVVGIVADETPVAVGGSDRVRPAVYLSALQHPPAHADVILSGTPGAVHAGVGALATAGWSPATASTLAAWRARAAAPLRWMGGVAFALALLTLVLAVHGVQATARQITRRRARELAIRRVVGATDDRLFRHVLAETLRTGLWGGFGSMMGGAFLVGLLQRAASGVPAPPVTVYVAVTAVLVLTALLASGRAARDALRIEPATLLE